MTTTAPPVANSAQASIPVPSETISWVGPITATSASARTIAVPAIRTARPVRLQFADRRGRGVRRVHARDPLLAVEAVQDQQREADAQRQAGHGAQRDADGVERDQVTEQRDLAETRQGADRADGGHQQSGHRRAQPDQQQHEHDRECDQFAAAQVLTGRRW